MLTCIRILFVSGVWVPASGGSEISAHTLATELSRRGHHISVLTGPRWDGRLGNELIDGLPVRRVAEAQFASNWQHELIAHRPQVVLTQLMWSEWALAGARQGGVPSVYFLRSVGPTLDLSPHSPLAPTAIVANSPTTRAYAQQHWRRDALVVLPTIRLSDYQVPTDQRRPQTITMVNPIEQKGGDLFRRLATSLPHRRFLAVQGWHHWKRPDGSWDMHRLAASARSYGATTVVTPEIVPLDDLPNVEIMPAVADMRPVYARTRVLVVPSVWAEPFGRVIVEAMTNGIPVLYSGTGSSDLAAGGAGIRVPQPDRVDSWIEALTTLDDAQTYADATTAARCRATTYDLGAEVDKVHDLVVRLAGTQT